VALARAKIKEDVTCRKCRVHRETLGHILGQCSSTKKERIARHDTIKDFMLKRIMENDAVAIVTREPSLQLPHGEVLKLNHHQLLRIEAVTWSVRRIPMAVISIF
jgi:hypothetical protein